LPHSLSPCPRRLTRPSVVLGAEDVPGRAVLHSIQTRSPFRPQLAIVVDHAFLGVLDGLLLAAQLACFAVHERSALKTRHDPRSLPNLTLVERIPALAADATKPAPSNTNETARTKLRFIFLYSFRGPTRVRLELWIQGPKPCIDEVVALAVGKPDGWAPGVIDARAAGC